MNTVTVSRTTIQEIIEKLDTIIEKLPKEQPDLKKTGMKTRNRE